MSASSGRKDSGKKGSEPFFERRPERSGHRAPQGHDSIRSRSDLGGRIAVVTGGTAGVGFATAAALAERGATTVVLSRDGARVEAAVASLRACGANVRGWPVDVSEPEAVRAVARRIEAELGPIDIWINNAMTTVFGLFAELEPAEFAKATANTYLGTVYGTRAALDHMLPRNRGTIVQVGSALAYQSIPLQSAYCGAKHAIRGFTNAVRCELMRQRSGVRLTMVQLSAFNTPQFDWARSHLNRDPRPLAPVFEPALAAETIVRAALLPRREYWVGWPAVKAIIGSRVFPGLADRLAAATAFRGQLGGPASPRDGNLFAPVPRPPGATGRFGDEARSSSRWPLAKHRRSAIVIAAAVLGAVLAAALSRRR
jgi:NAD(P)-dependent dehydrogenase (short-subunit alcohol dehydrogenase family)